MQDVYHQQCRTLSRPRALRGPSDWRPEAFQVPKQRAFLPINLGESLKGIIGLQQREYIDIIISGEVDIDIDVDTYRYMAVSL